MKLLYLTLIATIISFVEGTDEVSLHYVNCSQFCQDQSAICRIQAERRVSKKILCYVKEDKCITKCQKKKKDRMEMWLKMCHKICKVLFIHEKDIRGTCRRDCNELLKVKTWFDK